MNRSRLRPFHTVLFIFIVSNCAGALTPIGDPPLFLGYLNGVPFAWTILNCWAPWLVVNALLLAVFGILDSRVPCTDRAPNTITLAGWKNIVCLGIILIGVFIDQLLAPLTSPHLQHVPFGALLMLAAASVAYRQSDPRILQHNHFHFGPIKEVALLFLGIFATMMPRARLPRHPCGATQNPNPRRLLFRLRHPFQRPRQRPRLPQFSQRRARPEVNPAHPRRSPPICPSPPPIPPRHLPWSRLLRSLHLHRQRPQLHDQIHRGIGPSTHADFLHLHF